MIKKLTCILIMFSLLIPCGIPAAAADAPASTLAANPRPLYKTHIKLAGSSAALHWYEDKTVVTADYHLVNPTARKIWLTMCIPVTPITPVTVTENSSPTGNKPAIKAAIGEEELEIRYSKSSKLYIWDIAFNANEELNLTLEYTLANDAGKQGMVATGFNHIQSGLWNGETEKSTVLLAFSGIHPGQITEISPGRSKFAGYLLDLTPDTGPDQDYSDHDYTVVTADIESEKLQWSEKLSENEKALLAQRLTDDQYAEAAFLFADSWERAAREDKEPLRIAQAYYLEKAGKSNEASIIWKELYDRDTKSARVYWALGKEYAEQESRLIKLYNQAKDLRIHPLLQGWLAAQISPAKAKPSMPDISEPDFTEGNKGLTFNCKVTDPDGDIERITLSYHWEKGPEVENIFELKPFKYVHETEAFIPAKQPLQRLFYEVTAVDASGNSVTTGLKETFYLNSEIPVEIFPLSGATMITGDLAPDDQAKVHNWFKSYLKMAKKAEFIPIEAKRPYFIFIGKPHAFIDQYKGPLFLHYTPAPFASEKTKIPVHRYFLSYWYGPGWNNVPEDELIKLGDSLLLGKGFYVLTLKYLNAKDPQQFAAVLGAVGEGKGWDESVREIYRMEHNEILLKSLWHSYGNNVLAVIIIIVFAWLGKTGYLVRFLNYLRAGRA